MILDDMLYFVDQSPEVHRLCGGRIYVTRAPQGKPDPLVVLQRVSGDTPYALSGEVGTTETIVSVTAYASDPNGPFKAGELFAAIRNRISGYGGSWQRTRIDVCKQETEPLDKAEWLGDANTMRHGVEANYLVVHAQPIPNWN